MQPHESNASENCLFINIYTPHEKFVNPMKKSVMFWIHGGTYITGSIFSGEFNATYLSLIGDVVVVEVNYRLSAFGFLYDGTDEAPGNQAFTDYLVALNFVKENIAHFGGDPNSVTIFGESAGSMAVSSLVMMKNQNLFHRAIMQSGSVNSYVGSESKESAHKKSIEMAKEFDCFDNKTDKINVSCLRKVDTQKIVTFTDKKRNGGEFFCPIYGDKLLPIKPSLALENGDFK
jgi:carboxylesterase type B